MRSIDATMTLQQGEELKENGEYIVLSGHLTCCIGDQLLCFLRKSERAIVHNHLLPEKLRYQACNTVKVLKLDSHTTNRRIEYRYRAFERELVDMMVQRMEMLMLPKKERLVYALSKLGNEVGNLEGGDCYIPNVWSQAELASYINCTREYLLNQKKALKKEGLILDNRHWVLLDWNQWTKEEEKYHLIYD
ncbi:Crp/Fnr family transcriptional regulator [Listeria sp. FSL L7-1582]|uniref:helix-turn-helix domain-containing protein n=1 Tax=Listeria portnoyi TaxID=2713504 RepID=UPI00164E8757|nr:Crp/Fnr family transcriptional regulator [Listeria portnoyi]MBC6309707.1 Crp/Fnr family transcriptional regulator [Listeria portnoyi]